MTISSPRREFDYVEDQSCLRAQCNCFCGTGSFRFCCRRCPPMKESTITRVIYIVFLMTGVLIMALFMSGEIQIKLLRLFPEDFSVCEWLGAGRSCHAGKILGYLAVYRIGLALSLYHLVLMLATCGVKSSKDCRAAFHNGLWLYKVMLLLLLGFVAFMIPDKNDYFINVWMYVAMTGGAAFIVFQLMLFVFMVHKWTDRIQDRVENGGSAIMWYAVVGPGLAILLFLATGIGVCLLYIYFAAEEGCYKNQWFIFINAGACFIVSVVAGVRKDPKPVGLRLLHASVISLYVIYLTWVAISSAPRRFQRYNAPSFSKVSREDVRSRFTGSFYQDFYCGPNGEEEIWADRVIPYVSFVITFLSVVYGSIGISEPEKCRALELPGCPVPQVEGEDHDRENMGGQVIIRNEKKSLVYSYALFHGLMILAALLMMMHLTQWQTPSHATLVTFGRSWSSVWIKICSSWVCLAFYFVSILCPSILPSMMPSPRTYLEDGIPIPNVPVIEINGHAMESDGEISEEAVPLTIIRRPTILTHHQETTV